jgi:hypothetical protein
MKVERVVIDSNVWIAALITPTGTAGQMLDALLSQDIDILLFQQDLEPGQIGFGQTLPRLQILGRDQHLGHRTRR